MSARFPAQKGFVAEGSRGPSVRRLVSSPGVLQPGTVQRGPLFGSLTKRRTIDDGTLSRSGSAASSLRPHTSGGMPESGIIAKSADEMKKAQGALCFVCGAATLESGRGLRQCPVCRSIQLAGGGMSNAFAVKHADDEPSSRQSSKRVTEEAEAAKAGNLEAAVDSGTGNQLNPLLARSAWRRISQDAQAQMAHVHGCTGQTIIAPGEEREPIMAGFVDTGYAKGDRVKTTLRLPGAIPGGVGWDPIDCQTDEGVVIGPGNKRGEIMVQFDHSGHNCSMKMGQITHVKIKEPTTNVDRSRRRKSHLVRLSTIG